MGRKGKNRALISAAAAAALAILLLIAGALLHMHTDDLGFWEALKSFVRATFLAGTRSMN